MFSRTLIKNKSAVKYKFPDLCCQWYLLKADSKFSSESMQFGKSEPFLAALFSSSLRYPSKHPDIEKSL
ncbi:hypothetical protein DRW42_09500 [Pedobacter miscanthi]|uniref:Uncharacterized protein n=1 Tax=Pedobacter miscanthi TaxID=2259170 RepID=A0A366L2X3_9SPHI|nr:hypothetical protein DRW42_09500 [Pedobacter miscanthi]